MVSLRTAGNRFNSTMYRVDGMPFQGTVEPDMEGKIIGYDFSFPRRILRIDPGCGIKTLDAIRDVAGRYYLVADHDVSFSQDTLEYRTHLLIPLVKKVKWERETKIIDTLTKMQKSTGRQLIDDIWILPERVNREQADGTIRVKEQAFSVFTGHKLELNDIVDSMVVKRLDIVRGVYLAEIQ